MWTSAGRENVKRVTRDTVLVQADLRRGWPTAAQEELLRVVLSPGRATPLWEEWRSRHSIEDVDVHRLVPALYDRLSAEGTEGGQHLRGVSRHCYVNGAVQRRAADRVVATLGAAGIPALAMKGLAMSAVLGKSMRHMSDFDMLVPRGAAEAAIRIAMADGWESGSMDLDGVVQSVGELHSAGLLKGSLGFDLHWFSNHVDQSEALDGPVWERSLSASGLRVPSKADLLLQIAVHGVRDDSRGHVWPLDAALVFSGMGGEVRWDQLVETALRRRLVLQVRSLAEALACFVPGSVPGDVLDVLALAEVTQVEILEHRGVCDPGKRASVRAAQESAVRTMRDVRRASPEAVPKILSLEVDAGRGRPLGP